MKKEIEMIICSCCGKKVQTETVKSMLICDYGLDNKPQFQWQLPVVQECSNCHFCGFDIEKPIGEDIRKIVMSQQYQKIMKNVCEDKYDRKVKAAAKLSEDITDKIYLYSVSCWNLEFNGRKMAADAMREKAVALMEKCFLDGPEFKMVMVYIDSLRQLNRFHDALETIESIEQEVERNLQKEDILYVLFQYEKKLLNACDSKFHMFSELME